MTIAGSPDQKLNRRLRLGMVGGGRGAFIGAVHRIAARLDDRWELVAGALSSDPERARLSGEDLLLKPDRIYGDFNEMARRERRLKDGIDAVAIVTPEPRPCGRGARLPEGRHPRHLRQAADDDAARGRAAREARAGIGPRSSRSRTTTPAIRSCGRPARWCRRASSARSASCRWNTRRTGSPPAWRRRGSKQAEWRTDPARSGPAGAVGDIGTHAFNLAEFIAGDEVASLSAELHTFVEGRRLDDNAHMMLRFASGARRHALVQPGRGGPRERPAHPRLRREGRARMACRRTRTCCCSPRSASRRASSAATAMGPTRSRAPPRAFRPAIRKDISKASRSSTRMWRSRSRRGIENREPDPFALQVPTVEHGVRGVRFIEAAVRSSQAQGGVGRSLEGRADHKICSKECAAP